MGIMSRSYTIKTLSFVVFLMNSYHPVQAQLLPEQKDYFIGLLLGSASHGNLLGGYLTYPINRKYELFIQATMFDVVGEEEFSIFNPYTLSVEQTNVKNLNFLPIFAGFQFHPFKNMIYGNFSPFIVLGVGPLFAFDTEEEGTFTERWSNVDVSTHLGGLVGIGLQMGISSKSFATIAFGYGLIKLNKEIDDSSDYSGLVLQLMFAKKKKY